MIALPSLPSYWPVALALLAFGALGLRRGWVRELATLGIVLLAWVIVLAFGLSIVGFLNRIALIASFTWHGGFDAADPSALLRALRSSPAIDHWHPEGLYLLLFGLAGAAAYPLGDRLASRARRAPGSPADAALGGLAGAVNGYLLAYVSLGYLHGALRAPASEPLAILGGYATTLAVTVVAAAVGLALFASTRGQALKPKRSGRASG
jgi:hypothetical protein